MIKWVTNQGAGAGQTPPSDQTHSVNAEQLRAFVERFERLETEKKDITEAQNRCYVRGGRLWL